MIHASGSIAIDDTPESVFRWLDDPDRVCQWVPQMVANHHTSPAEGRVGTEFHQQFQVRKRIIHSRGRIIALDDNRRIGLRVQRRWLTITIDYRLKPNATQTIVQQDVQMQFTGLFVIATTPVAPLIRWIAKKRIGHNLSHLKQAIRRNKGH